MTIRQVIIRIASIILIVETLIMLGLDFFSFELSTGIEVILDAAILVLFSTPIIYLWVIKPFVLMRDKAIQDVAYMEFNDLLTGLPNRVKFLEWLEHIIFNAATSKNKVSILLLDINRFKRIHDTFGDTVANEVIKVIAIKLKMFLGRERFLARIGPDQFSVLVENMNSDDEIYSLSKNIIRLIEEPIIYEGQTFSLEACMGISEYPKDAHNNEDLLKYANNAMRQAKVSEEKQISFFTPELTQTVQDHFSLEEDLRNAFLNNEFFLLYQPKIHARTQELIGVEALIRWNHPQKGLISPTEFIPVAENMGLIIPIGQWVLREALSQLKIWINEGKRPVVMSTNLSGRQLNNEQITHIMKTLKSLDIPMEYVEFEITETYLMKDIDRSQELLEQLHDSGVSISLDDFGSGYSSLGYLKRFKIDTLKIDQMLIRDIETDKNDFAIAEAIVAIGHALDLKVIAEGVETQEQMKMLQKVGCDYFQGYYFSKPIEADKVFSGDTYRY